MYTTGCVALCNALSTNDSVISLTLSNNNIGDMGAGALAEMLAKNKRLR